ncbi:hypothetical protein B9Z65_3106 [Elsinoe australis]|uniref:Uncharacterized protein n=1 Tax=Elsinoe australis TaxID=40998 RepID=A0A2P7ZUF1_9PEZI|nr:hypothetical protein B9Z65_3106 [Elsinoe australis]
MYTPIRSTKSMRSASIEARSPRATKESIPADWPTDPTTLQAWTPSSIIFIFLNALGTVACCAFIGLAILCWTLDGQQVVLDDGSANVLGQIAEQASILVLEILVSSRSIYGAVESQFYFGQVTVAGLLILLLWSLSPIGGQASLRLLARTQSVTNTTQSIVYAPTGPMGWPSEDINSTYEVDRAIIPTVQMLYGATICAPAPMKRSPEDIWGNVRIPTLEAISVTPSDLDGWHAVPENLNVEDFASLSGLPVNKLNLQSNTTATFEVDYSYTDLKCTNNTFFDRNNDTWTSMLGYPYDGTFLNFDRTTNPNQLTTRPTTPFFTTFDSRRAQPLYRTNLFATPRILTFGANFDRTFTDNSSHDGTLIRNCTLQTKYISARIHCTPLQCRAVSLRPSPSFQSANPNVVPYAHLGFSFARTFPFVLAPTSNTNSTQEIFLRGEDMPCAAGAKFDWTPFTQDVPDGTFGRRLALAVNTYVAIRMDPYSLIQGVEGPEDTRTWVNGTETVWPSFLEGEGRRGRWGTAVVGTGREVYRCRWAWVGVQLVAALVLLGLSVGTVVLRWWVRGPDVLGYVASLTYGGRCGGA